MSVIDRAREMERERDATSDFEVDFHGTGSTWQEEREGEGDENTPLFETKERRNGHRTTQIEPKDKFLVVWLVFYMLGMTTLLPWNFFIAVNDYWHFKFRDVDSNSTTPTKLQKEFTSYLSIASNIPNALFVILNVFYGQRFGINQRLLGALAFMATLFVGVLIMTKIDSDAWQSWFLFSTLLLVVLLNVCTAIYQGGLVGVCGKFPSKYMGGMMAGQALGGIFPALVNIAVIAGNVSPESLGFSCFLTALLWVLLSILAYTAASTAQFFKFHAGLQVTAAGNAQDPGTNIEISYKEILRKSWRYQISVLVCFFSSLTVFPSVTVLITSQYSSDPSNVWATTYFTPVACFLLFNCGDYLGRILASWIRQPSGSLFAENLTLVLCLLRLVFIPCFMFCRAATPIRSLPVIFNTDADYYALMVIFSVSNGYLGNLCMMLGPKTSDVKEEQEKIASLMVAVLVLGIGLGSACSYPVVNML